MREIVYIVVYHDVSRDEDYIGMDVFANEADARAQFLSQTGWDEKFAEDYDWHYDSDGYEIFIKVETVQPKIASHSTEYWDKVIADNELNVCI